MATKKQPRKVACVHAATTTVSYASGPGDSYVLSKWCQTCGALGQTLGRADRKGREVVPVTEWTKPACLVDRPLKGRVKR